MTPTLRDGKPEVAVAIATWHVDNQQATLRLGRLRATLDLARPAGGLHAIQLDGDELVGAEILGLDGRQSYGTKTSEVLEVWPCGPELAALYPATLSRPVCTHAVWRATLCESPPGALALFDLKVSVRTEQPESWPELNVRTVLPTAEVLRLVEVESGRFVGCGGPGDSRADLGSESGPCCLVMRLLGTALSYIEMVYPPDFQGSQLMWPQRAPPRLEIRHRLFAARLEKGVIRRAWVRGVVAKRAEDIQTATLCYSALAAAEPPLST